MFEYLVLFKHYLATNLEPSRNTYIHCLEYLNEYTYIY
jgi:hypothetical protein